MYAISLWLIASLRIFSGRPVLTDSACDDEASDDEMEYMILPKFIRSLRKKAKADVQYQCML